MANQAFPRPQLTGQPVSQKTTVEPKTRPLPLMPSSSGEVADRLFGFAMLTCAVANLGLLVLIVYLCHAGLFATGADHRCATRVGCGRVHDRNVSQMAPRTIVVHHGITGGDSKCNLRTMGDFCPGSAAAPVRAAISCT